MIKIVDFKPFQKNTLQGFLTIRMTNIGLEIKDVTYHKKGTNVWFCLPSKPYKKDDGTDSYIYILKFYDQRFSDSFQAELRKLVKDFGGRVEHESF